ncbi:hypothetical protein P3T36_007261 [Kitasatospora sp. MAP12-15]|uniref:hypothetical protein n=1 Tax=unclassified Kitasatospora TaxID=2633591 RepID=UPI0024763D00|nr:hypothetical protein [Kitasatospora sp. MAP12-44]MDH6115645.1 hypothetical protein [Kitasatospora sp. MAP12-44]
MTPYAIVAGAVLGGGLALLVRELAPAPPELGAALDRVEGKVPIPLPRTEDDTAKAAPWWERAGSAAADRFGGRAGLRIPLQDLDLVGQSPGEFLAAKAALALLGLLLPSLMVAILVLGGWSTGFTLPVLGGPVAAAGGWLLPDFALRDKAKRAREEATWAFAAYMELAAMERASDAGAQDSLERPSEIADGWVFRRIRGALMRARLDRVPPWEGLRTLGQETGVSAAEDIADIVSISGRDGAAIYETLRARSESLAGELIAAEQARANQATESMAVPVTLLSMVLLVFLAFPAMIRIFLM